MVTVKENLIAAKALIDSPEKWWVGNISNADETCFCAMGALGAGSGYNMNYIDTDPLMASLIAAIPTDFRFGGPKHRIAQFNDHPDTTHADIMALFDRAIAAQDEVSP